MNRNWVISLGRVVLIGSMAAACAQEVEPAVMGTPVTTPPAPSTPAVQQPVGGAASSAKPAPVTPTTPMAGPAQPAAPGTGTQTPGMGMPAVGGCNLKTRFAGDEYCIAAPPPDKGFQLHIGPSNYENPEPQYILEPGQEDTRPFQAMSPNTQKVYFYNRQFRMRPGAHHNIITAAPNTDGQMGGQGGGFDFGHRIGTSNNLSEDSPKNGMLAPENQGVGIPLDANTRITVDLHSINTTQMPQLREIWVNFWYRDEKQVTEPVEQLFAIGDPTFAIEPGADTILGPYRCTTNNAGRMLWFYGHRHANNVRFSAWRVRGGQRDLFYEAYHWEEPLLLEYASTIMNPKPDRQTQVEGGWSGILDLQPGDQLEWECHVVNKTDGTLRFANETFTAEMCIMDAELVGTNCRQSFSRGGGGEGQQPPPSSTPRPGTP